LKNLTPKDPLLQLSNPSQKKPEYDNEKHNIVVIHDWNIHFARTSSKQEPLVRALSYTVLKQQQLNPNRTLDIKRSIL